MKHGKTEHESKKFLFWCALERSSCLQLTTTMYNVCQLTQESRCNSFGHFYMLQPQCKHNRNQNRKRLNINCDCYFCRRTLGGLLILSAFCNFFIKPARYVTDPADDELATETSSPGWKLSAPDAHTCMCRYGDDFPAAFIGMDGYWGEPDGRNGKKRAEGM